ncbi:MAG TPA: TIGR03435 family protein [Verrucomicrobiae bacterium]|nr:TIGR03435 family protein [Verrucomicrobiae bacterium]
MTEPDDHQLLAEFARENSEAAFAALVSRHVNLVYSTALRSVGNAHAAEEISQAVFIILAQKADKLSSRTVISGWLYQTTRLTAANFLRGEIRRQQREQEAYMQSTLNESQADAWPQIAPLLDAALGKLGDRDRNAIVLRFFENKSLAEVGAGIGASEDAAKMRVNRALEKLRKIFTKRGVTLSATLIAGAVSASSVQAAPVGLAATISTMAITKGAAAGGSTLTLVKGVLKLMAWTKAKTAVVVGAGMLLTAGTATVVEKAIHPKLSETNLSWANDPKYWQINSEVIERVPPVFILRPTRFPQDGGSMVFRSSSIKYSKRVSKNSDLKWLMASAYGGYSQQRCVFPSDMPDEHYDFMFTLPEDYQKRMQSEMNSKFGLTAHIETRVVDVWLLRVKVAGAAGLKRSDGTRTDWIGLQYGAKVHGQEISNLIGWLEGNFGRPILDRTGLKDHFDMDLNWKPRPGQPEKAAISETLLDQLGLELVPGRAPVEMLVVEKAK